MNTDVKFILVDDDPINNMLCGLSIKNALSDADIRAFTTPEKGLEFIQNEYSNIHDEKPAILLLDINMPTLTGWEFMEQFDSFSDEVKSRVSVYILSSSVDERDKERARADKYIKGFISKPIEPERVLALVELVSSEK